MLCVAALAALLSSGCVFHRTGVNDTHFTERVFSKVEPGKTTLADLEGLARGPATSITPMGSKRLYIYSFSEGKTSGLALIILNITKTNSAFDTALFLVDEKGVIEWKQMSQNAKEVDWEWWAFGD